MYNMYNICNIYKINSNKNLYNEDDRSFLKFIGIFILKLILFIIYIFLYK